jgi:hypothetical protein
LHQGTLDEKEICNWIRAHATFLDWALKQDYRVLVRGFANLDTTGRFRKLAKIWTDAGCADLVEYYAEKGNFDIADRPVYADLEARVREVATVGSARGWR